MHRQAQKTMKDRRRLAGCASGAVACASCVSCGASSVESSMPRPKGQRTRGDLSLRKTCVCGLFAQASLLYGSKSSGQ